MSGQTTDPSQPYTGYATAPSGAGPTGGDEASMKDKAAESAEAGKQAAGEVAQTAADHAKEVAQEAQSQARNLVGEARDQLRTHAGDQHRNAVSNLRSLGDELRSMVDNSQDGGVATEFVGQAADRAHGVADWLDGRQPEDLLDELRRFARRRPGAFLAGALVAGVLAGRLTRGAVAAHSDDSTADDAAANGSSDAHRPLPGPGSNDATASAPAGGYGSGIAGESGGAAWEGSSGPGGTGGGWS